MCSYLFHCLLPSLMPIFTPVTGFLCVPHVTPAPNRHGRAPGSSHSVSYFHSHVSAQFLSYIPLTVTSPDGFYLMQHSCGYPLLLIPFYVTPQVTWENVLLYPSISTSNLLSLSYTATSSPLSPWKNLIIF